MRTAGTTLPTLSSSSGAPLGVSRGGYSTSEPSARVALLERPSAGSSAPASRPAATAAASSAATAPETPPPPPPPRLLASVPRNGPGASNTRSVFSSDPLTKTVDPHELSTAGFEPSTSAFGASAATHDTAWPCTCGLASCLHPLVLVPSSPTVFASIHFACSRVVMSREPVSSQRPSESHATHVTSATCPVHAAPGVHSRPVQPGPLEDAFVHR